MKNPIDKRCSRRVYSAQTPSCSRRVYSAQTPSCSRRVYSAQTPSCSRRVYSAKLRKLKKSLRLKEYDYSTNGAYFVTICTDFKQNIIGERERRIIDSEVNNLPVRFKGVKIDFYVIMPDHIHLIIFLSKSAVPLFRVIQAFKSITTLRIKKIGFDKKVFWQRNYYEHAIRNENALSNIRKYIINNPLVERVKLDEI